MSEVHELTFGQRAVGLSFNPSGDDAVHRVKALFAQIIDEMSQLSHDADQVGYTTFKSRLAQTAITQAMSAKMWAVQALTWCD